MLGALVVLDVAVAAAAVSGLLLGQLVRMIGDGFGAVGWLRWCSPFGLQALARPYGMNRVLPLLCLAV